MVLDLLLTPERRAAAAKLQEQERERRGGALSNKHPALSNYHFGLARVNALTAQIDALGEGTGDDERRDALREQLAESFAAAGDFATAAGLSMSPLRADDYERRRRALECLGVKLCECPPVVRRQSARDAKGEAVETLRTVEEVWDAARAAIVQIKVCSLCYTVSAVRGG